MICLKTEADQYQQSDRCLSEKVDIQALCECEHVVLIQYLHKNATICSTHQDEMGTLVSIIYLTMKQFSISVYYQESDILEDNLVSNSELRTSKLHQDMKIGVLFAVYPKRNYYILPFENGSSNCRVLMHHIVVPTNYKHDTSIQAI